MRTLARLFAVSLLLSQFTACQLPIHQAQASPTTYLASLTSEFQKSWPESRTINLVFHGHSVPTGYFRTPEVNTLEAYPHLLLKRIKEVYPKAIVNVITTSIGGEQSEQGAERFKQDVLPHRPDLLFIDYSLNDRGIGLARAHRAWDKMIRMARQHDIPVILLTPSPDMKVDLLAEDSVLQQHTDQVKALAARHGIGLADSYAAFQRTVAKGTSLRDLMAQGNHPNAAGHRLIANLLFSYFEE
jgi:lysophospholipase L1-like esterase